MPDPFDMQTGPAPEILQEPCKKAAVDDEDQADATTGASPGTAQACDDLGLNSLEQNLKKFNIKPPGMS